MIEKTEMINGMPHTTYEVGIQDIIAQQMQSYALLMFALSFAILVYVLWNNFVRSPSNKIGIKGMINKYSNPDKLKEGLTGELGVEPSERVKKISRAMDEYIIIPALVMFYISFSYYLSIRG